MPETCPSLSAPVAPIIALDGRTAATHTPFGVSWLRRGDVGAYRPYWRAAWEPKFWGLVTL